MLYKNTADSFHGTGQPQRILLLLHTITLQNQPGVKSNKTCTSDAYKNIAEFPGPTLHIQLSQSFTLLT